MSLSVGATIGPYDILSLLGSGGMGEVYRARDSKLRRDVAIKVMSPAFAEDGDRLGRFEREARTLAALNHPNIAQIYGLEHAPGVTALVMELVEGPTLADCIAQGSLPLTEALPFAIQIAAALDAAHEQGIIHRDLKPANIKLRPDGTVKVLDFGLAKVVDSGTGNQQPATLGGESPTFTSPAVTQAGVILGTAAYMSPEQARGRPVDKRTDIWAFGCVLFEMLAGRTTFDVGDTVSDAVAAVLKSEPQWSALPAHTPPHIRTLLERCLQKDPSSADEGEVYLATLRDATIVNPTLLMKNHTAAGYSADGRVWFVKNDTLYARRLNRQARTLEGEPELMATGVASQPGNTVYRADFSVARSGTVAWRPGKAALAQITVLDRHGRLVATAGPPGSIHSVLLSPDESRLLASGGEWASVVEAGQPGQLVLPRGPGWIAWSDGSTLRGWQIRAGGRGQQILERVVDGSSDVRIIGEVADSVGRIHDLSADGKTLLAENEGKIYATRSVGTAEQRASTVITGTSVVRDARFSPDGRWIVYEADGMFVQPFPGPGRRRQLGNGTDPVWRADGREIVYLAQGAVWSIPVTGSGSAVAFGAPVKLFEGIRAAPGTNAAARPLAVSRDGSHFFIPQALEQPDQNVIHVMTSPK